MNHELVDLSFVQKRRNDASPAHHPDVFPFSRLQAGCEPFDWLVHEHYTLGRCRLHQTSCEDIVFDLCIEGCPGHAFLLKVERHIACLPAPQDRIDRFVERTHTIVALGTRPVEPVDRTVGTGDEAVGTSRDVDDDLSLVDHSGTVPQSYCETPEDFKFMAPMRRV